MLRSFFISLSKATWAQQLITSWKFAWRAASRFVAGNSIHDAVLVVRELNAKGMNVTLDHLGEATTTREDALKATEDILELLDEIEKAKIRANISVKLTQIGLALDEKLCSQNLEKILTCAGQDGNFVRVDMEDTPFTDRTIQMYRQMRAKGFDHTGLVIQSYLFRSEKDIQELLADGTPIRLVKGAYDEPPELAFPKKADVDSNYDLLTEKLIDAAIKAGSPILSVDGRIPPIPALGTHDQKRIEFAKDYATKRGMQKQAVEFQMLFGIRRDLQNQCLNEGYPVRIYVPYGTHWYQYYMRRLAERPANIWFFVSNYFRR
jgi:proline dehydrogenase